MKQRLQNLYSFLRLSPGYRVFFLLFLLPMFFVLHGNNENFGIIPIMVILSLAGKYLLITLAIIFFNVLWFRSTEKAFVFSFYLLLLFFFFGAIYDTLKENFPGSRIPSYTFLLPSILVISVIVYWQINRWKKPFKRLTRYLMALSIIFLAIELAYAGYYTLSGKAKVNDLTGDFRLEREQIMDCAIPDYPDIYFIVFDGYTSSALLKNEFNYNNDQLDSSLIRHNYFISASSRSNYNFTVFSLGSTFNMSYLKKGVETDSITPKNVMQAVNTMRSNILVQFLHERGYTFRNYGGFEMDYMPSEQISFFDYYYYDLIDKQTLYERIRRDIGWYLACKNIFTGKFRVPERYTKKKEAQLLGNENNYKNLLTELASSDTAPRFVYTHLLLPHYPFYLKSDGSQVADSAVIFNTIDKKTGYVDQVKYANLLLEKIIELSAKDAKRKRVVIIEGDHGYSFWDAANQHKAFPNLNTYYFSDHNYGKLYDGISPVNTFRVVLNKYFCQDLPMIKDSSIYLGE